jgi:hypothetical protein
VARPGIFLLAEEIALSGAGDLMLDSGGDRRLLEVFHVAEAEDLGLALGRLALLGNSLRDRLASGRCFARYAVIEDPTERSLAAMPFRQRIETGTASADGIPGSFTEGRSSEGVSGSTHLRDPFIVRFPLDRPLAYAKACTDREIWHERGKRQGPLRGLAARLPSGF